jgi:hypothetical protein
MSKYKNPFATLPSQSFVPEDTNHAIAATEVTPLQQKSDLLVRSSQPETRSWFSSVFTSKEVEILNLVSIESEGKRIGAKRARVACTRNAIPTSNPSP